MCVVSSLCLLVLFEGIVWIGAVLDKVCDELRYVLFVLCLMVFYFNVFAEWFFLF